MINIEIRIINTNGRYRVTSTIKDKTGRPILKRISPARDASTAGALVTALLLMTEGACKLEELVAPLN